MDPVKFPINSYESYFMTMVLTLIIFCAVSYFTQKEPFNLERMLHRGIYNTEGEDKTQIAWSFRTVFSKMVGVTPEYTLGDKFIAWSVFIYSFVYMFLLAFVGVVIWNFFAPWPVEWWGTYFLVVMLIVPGSMAFISAFWFGIGGVIDMFRLFRDLENRSVDNLDNGCVDGHVSLADKAVFERLEEADRKSHATASGRGGNPPSSGAVANPGIVPLAKPEND